MQRCKYVLRIPKHFIWFTPRPIAATNRAYSMHSQGRCPAGTEIKSLSECNFAAAYLKLEDIVATSDGQNSVHYSMSSDPPFCYYEEGELKFNEGSNSGSCSESDLCLCAGTGEFWDLSCYFVLWLNWCRISIACMFKCVGAVRSLGIIV